MYPLVLALFFSCFSLHYTLQCYSSIFRIPVSLLSAPNSLAVHSFLLFFSLPLSISISLLVVFSFVSFSSLAFFFLMSTIILSMDEQFDYGLTFNVWHLTLVTFARNTVKSLESLASSAFVLRFRVSGGTPGRGVRGNETCRSCGQSREPLAAHPQLDYAPGSELIVNVPWDSNIFLCGPC